MTRFDECLDFVLEREGGYVNHKHDMGGATNYGITQARYDQYRRSVNLPLSDVYDITLPEVSTIYRKYYWTPISGDKLPKPVDLVVFDGAVNSGPKQAAKWLQRAVGVKDDGLIGPVTLAAVLESDSKEIVRSIIDQRDEFYREIVDRNETQAVFLKGWLNRLAHVRNETMSA